MTFYPFYSRKIEQTWIVNGICILECVFEFRGGQNPFHDDRDQHRDPIGLNRLKGSQVQTGSFWQPRV